MSYRNELPEGTTDRLEVLLKQTKDTEVLRRVQTIYLLCAARISSKANSANYWL